jgi:hypothetical protein
MHAGCENPFTMRERRKMGRYRRGRYSSRETPSLLQTLVITVGSVLFICLFTWIFAQPGMWNMGNFLAVAPKPTPTAVPTQVPSDSNVLTGVLGFTGICAIVIGTGGLFVLGLLWLIQQQSKQKNTVASKAATVSEPFVNSSRESSTQCPQHDSNIYFTVTNQPDRNQSSDWT